jgi:Nucleotide modification associated domain 2
MSSGDKSSLYSYVLRSDSGFAPNPFGEYCTLACCKPQIRKRASVGDWIVGSGSKRTVGNEKMVYAMRITEKISFDEYACDRRFRYKIPSSGFIQERGDNIYFKDTNGSWEQRLSYHTDKQMNADLRGEFVLISNHFFYFGSNAVLGPERFRGLMSIGRWYRHIVGPEAADFVGWLHATYTPGAHGKPYATTSQTFSL